MTPEISRRDFIKTTGVIGASMAMFPSWMPRLAFRPLGAHFAQGAPGDVLVCVFLRGGLDGISAIVPYTEGKHYYDARPSQAVLEPGGGGDAVIDLDGQFGLHPSLAPLHEIYQEQDLAIVHATGLTDATRSHFDAMQFMEKGTPGDKSLGTGWIGRHLQSAAWENESPFRAVGMGVMIPQSLRGPVSPLSIQSIADFHFRGREDELRKLQQSLAAMYTVEAEHSPLGGQADLVWETIDTLQQLDASNYRPHTDVEYPPGEYGMALQQVAQLIKADVGLEVACIDIGGWDTHEQQGTREGMLRALLDSLARGLSAFYADLGDHMQNITLLAMSEFGRRVQENSSQGTDHGHGNIMFLMGGGIVGGQVFSRWPTLAPEALDDGDLAITTDYRDVLAEVLQGRLLNPAVSEIFPNYTPTKLGLVENRA